MFGGIFEDGETPQQALVREVQEEPGIMLTQFTKFSEYDWIIDKDHPNKKFVFYAHINVLPAGFVLNEG